MDRPEDINLEGQMVFIQTMQEALQTLMVLMLMVYLLLMELTHVNIFGLTLLDIQEM